MSKASFTANISQRTDFTKDLFVLRLDLGANRENFSFRAGQYCTIGFEAHGKWLPDSGGKPMLRPYSIVSSPHEELLELFVELVPLERGGNLTPLLHDMPVGTTIKVLPKPKGVLTFDPKFKNQVMVSTVTGIAPFMSMVREYSERGIHREHDFYILQGASYHNEFVYDRELMRLGRAWYNFTRGYGSRFVYIPTVSRPDEFVNSSWRGEKGRVNEIIEVYLECEVLGPEDTVVYVCGHPGMIEDVKRRLAPRGWSLEAGNLKEERFWKD